MSTRSTPVQLSATSVLVATLLSLAACGGGDSGTSSTPSSPSTIGAGTPAPATPAPAPGTDVSANRFAACLQTPAAGTVNFYLNSTRPRREWKTAMYAGEMLNARYEYASATATQPVQVRYSRVDAAAKTLTVVAQERFDATTGALTSREQYLGRTFNQALSVGQSETVNYTVKTLFPAGVADRSERIVRTFEGEGPVTLSQGRLDTCAVYETHSSVVGNQVTELSGEELYYVPGLSFVKSYFIDLNPVTPAPVTFNQTALVELDRSTAPVTYVNAPATTTPSLAACTAVKANQAFLLSANGSDFGSPYENSLRRIQSSSLNGVATTAVARSGLVVGGAVELRHFDPVVGFLKRVGTETITNNVFTARNVMSSNVQDLRNATIGQAIPYTVTTQYLLPTVSSATANESLTFMGHQRVSTVFGTRDTCKVKVDYLSATGNSVRSEILYYAPDLYWVRSEAVLGSGDRVTRELLASR